MISIIYTYPDYQNRIITENAAFNDFTNILNWVDEEVDTPYPQGVIVYHERSRLRTSNLLDQNAKTGIPLLDEKTRASDEFPQFIVCRGDRSLYSKLGDIYRLREDREIALELIESIHINQFRTYEEAFKCCAEYCKTSTVATNGR